jgi:hypothetical protein
MLNLRAWLLIVHISITLFLAKALNIWVDEAYSLDTSSQTLGYAIERSISYEIQPPLYFALLTLWRSLNDSVFWARLFSVVCIALAVYLSADLAQRYLSKIQPSWLTAAMAFHPYAIWAAVEIRAYALAVLISVLLLRWFYDGYLSEEALKLSPASRRAQILYGIAAIAGLYTHYFLACLLAGNAAALLLLRRWPQLRNYIVTMIGVGICFLPLLSFLLLHLAGGGAYAETAPLAGVRAALGRLLIFALPTASDWEGLRIMRLARYGLLGSSLLLIWLKRRSITASETATWGILVGTLLAFALVLEVTQTADLAYRYGYTLFAVTILGIFALLSLLRRGQTRRKILSSWAVILFILYTTAFFHTYRYLAKDGDWQRVAAYIMATEQPDQPILGFSSEAMMPFAYYYKGENPIVPLPRPVSQTEYDQSQFRIQDESEIFAALAKVPGDHRELWLVKGPKFIVGVAGQPACTIFGFDFNCKVLDQFVNNYYSVELDKDFYGSNVKLLRQKQDF